MSTEESATVSSSQWRDASNYAYTRDLTREAWALEFLVRNRAYAALVMGLRRFVARICRESPTLYVIVAPAITDTLRPWGLHFRRAARPPGGG
jgi:hypothetical protein